MLIKTLFYTFLIFLLHQVCFAQNIIGKVQNAEKKPVEFANVVVYQKEQIISFTSSNEKGIFFLENLPCDSLLIKISLIDYRTESLYLLPCLQKDTLQIFLVEENTAIESIIVRAKKDVVILKDTTKFDVESFSDGTEKNMEDLLRKLPGIEVDEKGKIKYFNKTIEKITLEGDDLTGRNYELLSRSMPIRVADKVQVIERFNENKLLKNIANSQAVILNFQVKKEYRNSIFGRMKVGIGTAQRQDYDGNATAISPNLKALFKAAYNNIGRFSAYIEELAESNTQSNTLNPADNFRFLKKDLQPILKHRLQGSTPLAEQISVLNNEKTASGHFVAKPTSKTKIKGGVLWGQDQNSLSNTFQTSYFNISQPFEFRATDLAQNAPTILGVNLNISSEIDTKTNFSFSSDILRRKTLQNYLSVANINTFNVAAETDLYSLDKQANWTHQIDSAKAIVLQIGFSERRNQEIWLLRASEPLQTPSSDFTQEPIKQNIDAHIQFFSFKSSFYRQKKHFKYAIGIAQNQKYSDWKVGIENFSLDSSLSQNNIFSESHTNLFGNVNYQNKKWAFNSFAEVGIFKNDLTKYQNLIFQQKSSLSKMVAWGNIEGTYGYTWNLPEFSEWANTAFYTDYRFFVQGSGQFNPAQIHELRTTFNFQKPYHLPYANFSLSYQLRQKGYILANQANESLVIGQWLNNKHFNFQNFTISGRTNIFSGVLLSNFNFETLFSYRTFQTQIDNQVLNNQANLFQIKMGMGSGFKGRFNFGSEWIGRINQVNKLLFNSLQGNLSLKYKFSPNFYLRFLNDFWGIWQSKQVNYSFFGNIEVQKSWKKIDFTLICHNIYNARSYRQQWNSEFFSSSNEVLLLSRYLMLKIAFNF